MSFKFRTVQNKINGTKAYGKWYAHPMNFGMVTTDDLCDEIAHSTTVTESDVRAVFAELKVVMRQHLLNNHSVKVDGLGVFSVSLKSTGADNEKDFKASLIRSASVNYLPESALLKAQIVSANGVGAQKVRYKKLLQGITFEKYVEPGSKKKADDAEGNAEENGNG